MTTIRDRVNVVATAVVGVAAAYAASRFALWAIVHAVWMLPAGAGSSACRALQGRGACWAVVGERFRFILSGAYPPGEQWRSLTACVLLVALYGATAVRAWWKPPLALAWLLVPAAAIALLRGGGFGLVRVPTDVWGGLPLTLVLATVGFVLALPFGIVLALGRRSTLPAVRVLSTTYIEVLRGLPVITVLFMASVMFPLFVPPRIVIDKLVRAQLALVLIEAAYIAEVVRGGLATLPAGQHEAAASLGLGFWPATLLIVLPQALRASIPALVNTFVAFFKDTSLVAIIGLFDLLGAAKAVIVDPKWTGFGVEVYLFAAALYFAFCFGVSRASQRFERMAGRPVPSP